MATTVTKRNYLSPKSLTEIQAIVPSATLDRIDRAEQAIDDYVGHQDKHVETVFQGMASSSTTTSLTDTNPASQLHIIDGYFANCVVEIIGGTGKGQVRFISDSSYDNRSVTITDAWDTPPDTTSFYRIYQLAKFPRVEDVYSRQDGRHYYKSIPDAVKDALLAQLEYIEAQGDAYFVGDQADVKSESVGNYSYSKGSAGQSASVMALAPRARTQLRGIKNSLGTLSADNPTSL
jgi:hypothetical protein